MKHGPQCNHKLSIAIANGNVDPTRTKTFRDAWAGKMFARWREMKGDIRGALITADVLGLSDEAGEPAAGLAPKEFSGLRADVQQERFAEWYESRLHMEGRPLETVRKRSTSNEERSWLYPWVKEAYFRGVERGVTEVKKITAFTVFQQQTSPLTTYAEGDSPGNIYAPEDISDEAREIFQAFTLDNLAQRTLNEMQGVTDASRQKILRILSDGIAQGLNPRETARRINAEIDGMTLRRSRMIARTETIRAYHEGALDSYEAAGMGEVTYQVEWSATPDTKTCIRCSALDGQIFKISEMRGMIPLHVNCRCAAIPVTPTGGRSGLPSPREIIGEYGERTGRFLGQ